MNWFDFIPAHLHIQRVRKGQRGVLLILAFCLFGASGLAQSSLNGAAINELLSQNKFNEAEALLRTHLNATPNDPDALFYLGTMPVRRGSGDYDAAASLIEKAIALSPEKATYYHWLGRAYGIKARDAGIFNATGYLGKIKDAFDKTLELEPNNFEARSEFIQFHCRVPGILGGSLKRAKELASGHERFDFNESQVLWVDLWALEEKYENAKAYLLKVKQPLNPLVNRVGIQRFSTVGFKLLEEKKMTDAQSVFEHMIRLYPKEAVAYHGLGRVLLEVGKDNDAVLHFEKALQLDETVGSQYRLGLIMEKRGEKQKAAALYERFLKLERRNDKVYEEVKQRLNALRS